jgi:alkylation response protein AidB-like acyl-CoA dehydrogenase
VSFPLADVDIALDAARLATWSLASRLDQITDVSELVREVTEVVALSTATAARAGVVGVNSLGGHGFLMDHPQERAYRDAGTLAAIDFDPLESDWDAVPTA